jgi:hypothetical protein
MYATLFGLVAATGRRISEALAMQLEDVTEDGLIIRQTKFHKSRLVPLHPTTQRALDVYINVRRQLGVLDGSLFVSLLGKRLAYVTVDAVFLRLARSTKLRGEPGQLGARMHDLRHPSRPLSRAVRARRQYGLSPPRSPEYLSRPCSCHEHLLVLAGDARSHGANSECRRGAASGRRAMTALAPYLSAFLHSRRSVTVWSAAPC